MRAAVLVLLLAMSGCKKPKANLSDLFDGGGAPTPIASASAPPTVVVVDAGRPSNAADLAKAKDLLADLSWCVAHKVTQNPNNAGEGDASTECDDVAAMRGKATDPDVVSTLGDAAALCAFDIPLVTANEALDHLRNGTSQASKLLMCTVAQKEIAKARAVNAKDIRVARAESRRAGSCR